MSILSKAKSIVKKVVDKGTSIAKTVVSAVKNTLGKNAVSSNLASAASAVNSIVSKPSQASKGALDFAPNSATQIAGIKTPTSAIPSYSSPAQTITSGQSYGPQLPVNINAGQQKKSSSSGGSSSEDPVMTDFVNQMMGMSAPSSGFENSSPMTINSLNMGLSAGGGIGGGSTGGAGAPSMTLPKNYPTSTNPNIDQTKLAGGLADTYTYNAKTGQYEKQEQKKEDPQAETEKLWKEIYGKGPIDINSDREVMKARAEKERIQQSLLAPMSELNAVIAQQKADLLSTRMTGAKEGVTEAVYGQQENAINYNAAIRALPLQATVASLQGELELASDYLTELKQTKMDQIKLQSDYNDKYFNAIAPYIQKKDERAYQEIQDEKSRQVKMNEANVQTQIDWSQIASKSGQAHLIKRITALDPASPTFRQNLAEITSRINVPDTQITQLDNGDTVLIDKNTGKVVSNVGGRKANEVLPGENPQLYGGLSTPTATAVRSVVSKYSSEPTIQNFATVQDGYNFSKSLDTKTKNPSDDQALIYSLAKTLDPGSVVREGEYATAQKYSQSWINAYGKGVTQAIAGTGFLSETARANIKKTIEQKYNSTKTSYQNQYKEYVGQINNLTGRSDGSKFIRNYVTSSGGGEPASSGTLSSGVSFEVIND